MNISDLLTIDQAARVAGTPPNPNTQAQPVIIDTLTAEPGARRPGLKVVIPKQNTAQPTLFTPPAPFSPSVGFVVPATAFTAFVELLASSSHSTLSLGTINDAGKAAMKEQKTCGAFVTVLILHGWKPDGSGFAAIPNVSSLLPALQSLGRQYIGK